MNPSAVMTDAATRKQSTLDSFVQCVKNFLQALQVKFPNCEKTRNVGEKLEALIFNAPTVEIKNTLMHSFITKFHAIMSPFYQRVRQKDKRIVFEIRHWLFNDLHFKEKFAQSDEQTHFVMFEHLQMICTYSNMYCITEQMPTGIMDKLSGISSRVAMAVQRGEKLNEAVMIQETMQIMSSATDADRAQMNAAFTPENIQNLMGMMGQMQQSHGGGGSFQGVDALAQQLTGQPPAVQRNATTNSTPTPLLANTATTGTQASTSGQPTQQPQHPQQPQQPQQPQSAKRMRME
ncbi:hypothetical protein OAM67_01465 [bacterium]|nr:hypothetical protein [bacterium]